MEKGLAIGIDLGTTTSLASIGMPDGKPRLLRDPQGHGIIPSVVSILPDGRILVGQRAKDRIVLDPGNTFYSTKRFIGRDMRLEENSWAAASYPYHINPGEHGTPCVEAYGRVYTLTDVAAMILTYMKKVAEQAAGMPVGQAVITVPANFNDVQRATTRQAGERAGFDVQRILNEPTAAALAYGLQRTKENERIAVYDFGGGTFDMTILEMRGEVYEVLATAGNTMLGGDDFDRRILDRMAQAVKEETGRHPNENQEFHQKLFLAAERLKCQLSDWLVAGYTERGVELGGKAIDFHFELSREQFNEACGDLVDTSFDVCDEVLRLANCTLTSIDQIILVGGTTRIPLLRERVTKYFLRPPLANIQPDTVVSLGAAIQAFALAGGPAMWPSPDGMPAAMARLTAAAASDSTRMVALDSLGGSAGSAEPPTRAIPLSAVRAAAEAAAGEGPTRAVPLSVVRAAAEASAGEGPTRAVPLSAVRAAAEAAPKEAVDAGIEAGDALAAAEAELERRRAKRTEERAARVAAVMLEQPPAPPSKSTKPMPALDRPRPAPPPPPPIPPPVFPVGAVAAAAGAPAAEESSPSGPPPLPSVLGGPPSPPEAPAGPAWLPGAMAVPSAAPAAASPVPPPLPAASGGRPPPLPFGGPAATGSREIDLGAVAPLPPDDPQAAEEIRPTLEPPSGLGLPSGQAGQAGLPADGRPGLPDPRVAAAMAAAPPLTQDAMASILAGTAAAPRPAPVLVDVTPMTLGIQTVGGNVESIIRRNSQVPVEQSRLFATTSDDQTAVVIRVCQGESPKVAENLVLGEMSLLDLPPMPRGQIVVRVTFEINTDGILSATAVDNRTKKAQRVHITLFGGG